jgi:GMP synthase-like glutamine amidotransferase
MFIQNSPLEGPGVLSGLFRQDGLDHTVIAADGKIPRRAEGPVVILGGPQGANDDSTRLRDQENLIRWCHSRDIPVLGICLGSQLAAKALGGSVHHGLHPEVGFYDDVTPDTSHPLFNGAPDPYTVFHWHQDTFRLPPGARRLASSPAYENQAFAHGSVVGLQFHLEIDAPTARTWFDYIARHPLAGTDPRAISESMCNLEQMHSNLEHVRSNLDTFYSGYKRLFGL